jgi:hypothetical protein
MPSPENRGGRRVEQDDTGRRNKSGKSNLAHRPEVSL